MQSQRYLNVHFNKEVKSWKVRVPDSYISVVINLSFLRYTNVDLKIYQYFRFHMIIIC